MRLIVKYSRDDSVKYISHLDIMRTFQRILRRSSFPVTYSKGFNEHMIISFAVATSLGITSECEYADIPINTDKALALDDAMQILNQFSCPGIRFTDGKFVEDNYPALMAQVARSSYSITLNLDEATISRAVSAAESAAEIVVMKRTKSGTKPTDIRPMILSQETVQNVILVELATGSAANLNPKLYIESLFKDLKTDYSIHRISLTDNKGNDLFSLSRE